jgi:hypothetical protein
MREVQVEAREPELLERLIGPGRTQRFQQIAARTRASLAGRQVLNVNSTAAGGDVAELLQTLVAYGRGMGIDARGRSRSPRKPADGRSDRSASNQYPTTVALSHMPSR